jgi:hypothetical protein
VLDETGMDVKPLPAGTTQGRLVLCDGPFTADGKGCVG